MLSKLKANPRLFINLVVAVTGAATAFGFQLTGEQVAAITTVATALASVIVGDTIADREVTR